MADAAHAPMGANLVESGATFRVWDDSSRRVSVRGSFNGWTDQPLTQSGPFWSAFVAGVKEGDEYKFFVEGQGSTGYKRDPFARELTRVPAFPNCNCIVARPRAYPWHDADFRPPRFNEIVLYQLHVGAFYATDARGNDVRRQRPGRFLDLLFQLDHLVSLGINAVQILPIQEFATLRSLGYNGLDYFSPEMDYSADPASPDFARYLAKANELLGRRGLPALRAADLAGQAQQLMALIDLLHLNGIAVILDVVYNHAGGGFDEESIWFHDREPWGDNNRSLYFTDQGWAGGLVFAYWKQEVRQFLIDNAGFFFDEYHVDGFRFDEVTVIDRFGGWSFLQDLTDTLRFRKPEAILIAEYWADQGAVLRARGEGGAGFDAVVAAELRGACRATLEEATHGRDAPINLDRIAAALAPAFGAAWRQVQHLENQDIVRRDNQTDRAPRVPAAADVNSRSWYATSRARVMNGLLLTAPGIPMLFMGQEILEDKYWSDSPDYYADSLIWWDGLASDRRMRDHLRFMRDLIGVRRAHPALMGDRIRVFHVNNDNRVIAFHRWVDGAGSDVVVVVSFNESTWYSYEIGFPRGGLWREIFNSDLYEQFPNPSVAGNGGAVTANGGSLHDFPSSAALLIPANSITIFAAGGQ
ncbi:MAG TPA: alpha-amylase family glycosyl hydrolase [Steroidobacteraceae bacterium]|nr:alpha-amylase family glycosyl hydrolase [Steroidobacteraceae bacterium]